MRIAIIGAGRVGLPFGLHLFDQGHVVHFCDKDSNILSGLYSGKMPFNEPGFDSLINEWAMPSGSGLIFSDHIQLPTDVECFVITLGTPILNHIEIDVTTILKLITSLCESRDLAGKILILRSTLAPGTMENITNLLASHGYKTGYNITVAYCPERIAEQKSRNELKTLPQIIGTENEGDFNIVASALFPNNESINCSYAEAELAKIFSNIYRYTNFAISNYMMYVSNEKFGLDFHKIHSIMSRNYPRNENLPIPGFVAGTCLRKDFGMIAEKTYSSDLIVEAYRVNEYFPQFISRNFPTDLSSKRVLILGKSFKRNSDDTRDNLTDKLVSILLRRNPRKITIVDDNLKNRVEIVDLSGSIFGKNYNLKELLSSHEYIVIAMDHDSFDITNALTSRNYENIECVLDIWNTMGRGFMVPKGVYVKDINYRG